MLEDGKKTRLVKQRVKVGGSEACMQNYSIDRPLWQYSTVNESGYNKPAQSSQTNVIETSTKTKLIDHFNEN